MAKTECWENRTKFMTSFQKRFGDAGPAYFADMLGSHAYLRREWDKACDLDAAATRDES